MLNELAKEVYDINVANGWDVAKMGDFRGDVNKVAAKLCLVHSEISEALEAVRKGDFNNFAEELADALIRILDLAKGLDVDMDYVVARKNDKNKSRGYRHGGKRL